VAHFRFDGGLAVCVVVKPMAMRGEKGLLPGFRSDFVVAAVVVGELPLPLPLAGLLLDVPLLRVGRLAIPEGSNGGALFDNVEELLGEDEAAL